MIRRDYVTRMVEQFAQALSRITGLIMIRQNEEALVSINEESRRLVGKGIDEVALLSPTDLMASLLTTDATQSLRDKSLMMSALFKQAGDMRADQGSHDQAVVFYLRALDLILEIVVGQNGENLPGFAPNVEELVSLVAEGELPVHANLALMQYFEARGDYARSEDSLFRLVEQNEPIPRLADLGVSFYERLLALPDVALASGNLPRSEAEAGLAELRGRLASG